MLNATFLFDLIHHTTLTDRSSVTGHDLFCQMLTNKQVGKANSNKY